ncbi:COG4315 family predicted lipoprotein [Streptomyces sp. CA-250714]|uniref:COG4315 family predicted lipoprotein n=1 Tax=Streptomyces sp. CA-250714 TaxID=3240060 RepID=UPI003D8D70C8
MRKTASTRKAASTRKTARTAVCAATAVLLATALSGCSDDGGGGASPSPSTTKKEGTVQVRSGDLGKFLVDGAGRTLYLFEADKSSKSTCEGGCAEAWPPVVVKGKAEPKAGAGTKSDLLGTSEREGGDRQVTYNGHPLYLYQGDEKAGDTNGQALDQFGAKWFVLDPSGKKIPGGKKSEKKPSKKPKQTDGGY